MTLRYLMIINNKLPKTLSKIMRRISMRSLIIPRRISMVRKDIFRNSFSKKKLVRLKRISPKRLQDKDLRSKLATFSNSVQNYDNKYKNYRKTYNYFILILLKNRKFRR